MKKKLANILTLLGVTTIALSGTWVWWYFRDQQQEFYREPVPLVGTVVKAGIERKDVRRQIVDVVGFFVDVEVDGQTVRAWAREGTDVYAARLARGDRVTLMVSERSRFIHSITRGGDVILGRETMLAIVRERESFATQVLIAVTACFCWLGALVVWIDWWKGKLGSNVELPPRDVTAEPS